LLTSSTRASSASTATIRRAVVRRTQVKILLPAKSPCKPEPISTMVSPPSSLNSRAASRSEAAGELRYFHQPASSMGMMLPSWARAGERTTRNFSRRAFILPPSGATEFCFDPPQLVLQPWEEGQSNYSPPKYGFVVG